MLLDIAISVILCLIISFGMQLILTRAVAYYGVKKNVHRELAYMHADMLQKYVTSSHVKSTDAKELSQWNERYPYVSILIRDNEKMCFNSFVAGNVYYDSWHGDTSYEWGSYVLPEYQMKITMEDETAKLTIGGLFYQYYYKYIRGICLGLLFLVFGISFLLLFRKYLVSIDAIRQRVNAIDRGEYDEEVHVDGSWELSQLAEQINGMSHRIKASIDRDAEIAREKDQFVRSIAHDIRSPLAAVIGYLDILLSGKADPSEQTVYLEKALGKANHIRTLTDYFFMMENPGMEPDLQEYDGNEVIASCAMEMYDFGRENGLKMRFENKIDRQFRVIVDRNLIQRILDNQNSNYVKYADPGVPIRFMTELKDGYLLFQSRNKIREKAKEGESHGLGLTICQAIARHMEGDYEYREEDGSFIQVLRIPIRE